MDLTISLVIVPGFRSPSLPRIYRPIHELAYHKSLTKCLVYTQTSLSSPICGDGIERFLLGYDWMVGLFIVLVMPIYTCLDSFLGDNYKDTLHVFKKGLECLYRFHQTSSVHCNLKWGNSMASVSSEASV